MILGNFRHRIVNIWNSLLNAVVDIDSVDLFKSRLDIFGCPKMLNMIRPTLSTLPVSEIDRSMTLKIFEKL